MIKRELKNAEKVKGSIKRTYFESSRKECSGLEYEHTKGVCSVEKECGK